MIQEQEKQSARPQKTKFLRNQIRVKRRKIKQQRNNCKQFFIREVNIEKAHDTAVASLETFFQIVLMLHPPQNINRNSKQQHNIYMRSRKILSRNLETKITISKRYEIWCIDGQLMDIRKQKFNSSTESIVYLRMC